MPEIGNKSPENQNPSTSVKNWGVQWSEACRYIPSKEYPFQDEGHIAASVPPCHKEKTQSLVSLFGFNIYLILSWSYYSIPFTRWSERLPVFSVFQNKRRHCHRSRLPCRHPQAWTVLECAAAPHHQMEVVYLRWLQQVLEALVCSMRNSVPHPHHIAFSLSRPPHMASLRAYASLHQSVGPCQFSMAFLHMGPDGWFWRPEHPESTPASLTSFYQSWVCQWIYIFPESKG